MSIDRTRSCCIAFGLRNCSPATKRERSGRRQTVARCLVRDGTLNSIGESYPMACRSAGNKLTRPHLDGSQTCGVRVPLEVSLLETPQDTAFEEITCRRCRP